MKKIITKWLKETFVFSIPVIFICGTVFIFYNLYKESKQQPTVNKIHRVDNKFELSDTLYFCNERSIRKKQYYSVYKSDSTEILHREDICHRCGKDFGSHGTVEMWYIKELSLQER